MIGKNIFLFSLLIFSSNVYCSDFREPPLPNLQSYSSLEVLDPSKTTVEEDPEKNARVQKALGILREELLEGPYFLLKEKDEISIFSVCGSTSYSNISQEKNLLIPFSNQIPNVQTAREIQDPEDTENLFFPKTVELNKEYYIPFISNNDKEIAPLPRRKRTSKPLEKKTFLDFSEQELGEFYTLCIKYKKDWRKIKKKISKIFKLKTSASAVKNKFKSMEKARNFLESRTRFTEEEDLKILEAIKRHKLNWIKIAEEIPSRCPISLKNRYYSTLRKRQEEVTTQQQELPLFAPPQEPEATNLSPDAEHSPLSLGSQGSMWNNLFD